MIARAQAGQMRCGGKSHCRGEAGYTFALQGTGCCGSADEQWGDVYVDFVGKTLIEEAAQQLSAALDEDVRHWSPAEERQ